MLKLNVKNQIIKQESVELSRRSFFSRFAVGTVLSLAIPSIAHAAKNSTTKSGNNHEVAHSTRSAVRLPKKSDIHLAKDARHLGKLTKTSSCDHERARTLHRTERHTHFHTRNTRLKDTHDGRMHSVIYPKQKESPFIADRGRLSTHRALAFQNPHTGDKLSLTYFEKGRYLNDALNEISYMLRDYRTGDVHPIDPELLDQLYDLKQMLGFNQPFDIVCGYRSPLTNARLHAEHTGAANNSFHIYGRAVDIRIERFDLRRIHNAALAMHRGGVGYYPESNFLHLDTGSFRTWSL